MRKITEYLLWLYVFTLPWDFVPLPGVGALTRLAGLAVVGGTVLTVLVEGRFRKPDSITLLAGAFVMLGALSLLWTPSFSATFQAVSTYAQLFASLLVIREIVRTKPQQRQICLAFCLGTFVPILSLIENYFSGVTNREMGRYTATGVNANAMGLILVTGLPLAWLLVTTRDGKARPISRAVSWMYFVLAPAGIVLTATRGAFLSGLIAISIVPLSLARQSFQTVLRTTALVILMIGALAFAVPEASWQRLSTIPSEVAGGGSMSTRRDIWTAGLRVFPQHPVVGVGAGAYGPAVASLHDNALKDDTVAHNMVLAILVENGIIGILVFSAMLGACAMAIVKFPGPDRLLWGVLMLAWVIGGLSGNVERWKVSWLLLGLVAAMHTSEATRRAVRSAASKATSATRFRTPVPADLAAGAATSSRSFAGQPRRADVARQRV